MKKSKVKSLNEIKSHCCSDNGGFEKYGAETARLISITPSERQLKHSKLEYYNFIHFGINTINNREWGTGDEDISGFNPKKLDTDQWCRVLKKSGSRGVIITAKHHDGFCLWNTKFTKHSVMNTPFGKDIVAMLKKSCDKFGLKLGIYLSPWDRHEHTYGTDEYNDFFVSQLEELSSNYGEIFAFWFDGACGEGKNGKKQKYDWERYYRVIRQNQPEAVICVCGPDVRWIGNEGGRVRKSEWSVVPASINSVQSVMNNSQKSEDEAKKIAETSGTQKDLGSRSALKNCSSLMWCQAEADVSITTGWFYHDEKYYRFKKKRTAKQLSDIYFSCVGGNASLLLNVPPDKDGLISEREQRTLSEFTEIISSAFKNKANVKCINAVSNEKVSPVSLDKSYILKDDEFALSFNFEKEKKISLIELCEDIRFSQRTEQFELYAKSSNVFKKIFKGTVIGSKKLIRLKRPVTANEIALVFVQTRDNPVILNATFYE